jgi:hypothetical protein
VDETAVDDTAVAVAAPAAAGELLVVSDGNPEIVEGRKHGQENLRKLIYS